jgi:hypothetical protein
MKHSSGDLTPQNQGGGKKRKRVGYVSRAGRRRSLQMSSSGQGRNGAQRVREGKEETSCPSLQYHSS